MNTQLKWRKSRVVVAALLALSLVTAGITAAKADLLGGLLAGVGIVVLVHQFGPQLNSFINTITANKGMTNDQATKVVPLLSIGQGTYAGMVQVTGQRDQVDDCKAVGILEGEFASHKFRARALVPIDNDNPGKSTNIKRVAGVGVSALIDVRL